MDSLDIWGRHDQQQAKLHERFDKRLSGLPEKTWIRRTRRAEEALLKKTNKKLDKMRQESYFKRYGATDPALKTRVGRG